MTFEPSIRFLRVIVVVAVVVVVVDVLVVALLVVSDHIIFSCRQLMLI